MFDLTGHVVVLTGGSRGIGRAACHAYARQGATVVLCARTFEAADEVAAELRAHGARADGLACNVSDRDQCLALIDHALTRYGRIDSLVLNAAANPVFGSMTKVDDGAFDKIIATNLKSTLWLTNAALPAMREQRSGVITIVSSVAGILGSKQIGVYGLSKAADFQMVRNLAVEHGPAGIRANAVAPGLVRTDFARALWENPKALAYFEGQNPAARIGEPDDIAGVIVFLSTRAAAYINGQTLVADGGLVIRDMA